MFSSKDRNSEVVVIAEKKPSKLGKLFGKKDNVTYAVDDGRKQTVLPAGSVPVVATPYNKRDSAFSTDGHGREVVPKDVIPVHNHGQFQGVAPSRNLALNPLNGQILDEDTGEIVSIVTTTTTTTTTTTKRADGADDRVEIFSVPETPAGVSFLPGTTTPAAIAAPGTTASHLPHSSANSLHTTPFATSTHLPHTHDANSTHHNGLFGKSNNTYNDDSHHNSLFGKSNKTYNDDSHHKSSLFGNSSHSHNDNSHHGSLFGKSHNDNTHHSSLLGGKTSHNNLRDSHTVPVAATTTYPHTSSTVPVAGTTTYPNTTSSVNPALAPAPLNVGRTGYSEMPADNNRYYNRDSTVLPGQTVHTPAVPERSPHRRSGDFRRSGDLGRTTVVTDPVSPVVPTHSTLSTTKGTTVSPVGTTTANSNANFSHPFRKSVDEHTVKSRSSWADNSKTAAIGLHGVGETLRGTLSSEIDSRFPRRNPSKAAAAAEKNRAILERGRAEIEVAKARGDIESVKRYEAEAAKARVDIETIRRNEIEAARARGDMEAVRYHEAEAVRARNDIDAIRRHELEAARVRNDLEAVRI